MRRRVLVSCILALIMVGCGNATPTVTPTIAPTAPLPTPTSHPVATPTATTASERLWAREFPVQPGSNAARLSLIDPATGARMRDLPSGVPTADWSTLYVTEWGPDATTVRALDPRTGQTLRETTVRGRYVLPEEGLGGTPGGLSPNGRWLVLTTKSGYTVDSTDTARPRVSMIVLDTAFTAPPTRIDLDGDFAFDAISPDGGSLYLIEHVTASGTATPDLGYKVRCFDLRVGALLPGVVVDKTTATEIMRGTRSTTVVSPNGQWDYSLYLRETGGPFIHALNLTDRYAVCIFLPKTGPDDWEQQLLWSLALTKDGRTLYAANGALGMVSVIDVDSQSLRRTVTLPATSAANPLVSFARWLMPHASAKRIVTGGATLTPDGARLLVIAEHGVVILNTSDLSVQRRALGELALDSIAVSPDGQHVYALNALTGDGDASRLIRLDLATGATTPLPTTALHLWNILRVA
jgi:DNA-binding beta-propeller fold protein YncE